LLLIQSLFFILRWTKYKDRKHKTNCAVSYLNDYGTSAATAYLSLLLLDAYFAKPLKLSSSVALRILLLSLCLMGMITSNIFNAGLTSVLTVQNIELPINTLQDILDNPSNKIIVLKGTASLSYFSEAPPNSVANAIWERKIKGNRNAMAKSLVEVEEALLQDDTTVAFSSNYNEAGFKRYPSKISKSSIRYGLRTGAIAVRKTSPYLNVLNYKISQYRTFGILAYLERRIAKPETNAVADFSDQCQPLGYENIYLCHIILLFGFVVSIFCCAIENSVMKCPSSKTEENKDATQPYALRDWDDPQTNSTNKSNADQNSQKDNEAIVAPHHILEKCLERANKRKPLRRNSN